MKSLLEKVNAKLNAQGGFLKAVSVLVGGTAFAQMISILVLPILTRIYSPDDFGVLSFYIATLSIISTIACGRLEIAIPLPKEDKQAFELVLLSFLSVIVVTILTLITLLFGYYFFDNLFGKKMGGNIWLLPLGVFLAGCYAFLQFWSTRKKDFRLIAKTRMVQSVSGSAFQLIWGVGVGGVIGLIIGHIIQSGMGFLSLFNKLRSSISKYIKVINIKDLQKTLIEYKNFPKYSTWESLSNVAGIQLPILMIAFYLSEKAGFLMLAMRVIAIPMGLIGGAMSQVYLAKAADEYNKDNLRKFTLQTIATLIKFSILPFLIIAILSPLLAPVIFGKGWEETGWLILVLVPWFFMQFITSPVSMALHITNNQKTALFLQIFGLLFRVGVIVFALLFFVDYILYAYSISGFIFYIIYLLLILKKI